VKKKLLLIQPSPYDKNREPIKKPKLYFVGLAMPLLAALTPSDWEVETCIETIEDVPFETDATLVAISTMGHGVLRSIDLAHTFMEKGKKVILGGYMASIMAEEASKHCHSVVIGDAEDLWLDVLKDVEADTMQATYERKLTKLTTPLPRFDLILNKNIGDFLPVQAGRGCPKACSFCSVACLYQSSYYKRDMEEVIRDIKQVKDLGFKKFMLLDDNIFSDRAYLLDLLMAIKPLKMQWMSQCSIDIGEDLELLKVMKESGCMTLSFGLESISYESLKNMDKAWAKPWEYKRLINQIRDAGIDVSTEMVVGGDGDTLASIKATKSFIEDNKISVPRFYILTPIPGTKFFKQMQAEGRMINDNIYAFDGTKAEHIPLNMTPDELTSAYWDLYESLFTLKSIIKRNILRRDFIKAPFKFLFYVVVNLYYRNNIRNGITPNIF